MSSGLPVRLLLGVVALLLLVAFGRRQAVAPPSHTTYRVPGDHDVLESVVEIGDMTHAEKYPALLFDQRGGRWTAWTCHSKDGDAIIVRSPSGDEVRLDGGAGVEGRPAMALDGDNRIWIAWHGYRGGVWSIFARSFDGTWSDERRLSAAGQDGLHPALATDSAGALWLAWQASDSGRMTIRIAARHKDAWTVPVVLASAGNDTRPVLARRREGGVWVAWTSNRAGNDDIWLSHVVAHRAASGVRLHSGPQMPVTSDAGFDDSPSLALAPDGSLWIAWNSTRSHASDSTRVLRHTGDAFVRVLRGGQLLSPAPIHSGAQPGQVSYGSVNHSEFDAENPYWHWPQTQNYPRVFIDGTGRVWIIWRTDHIGAHNFNLWGRVWFDGRWSPEIHLTEFSPGRDEWPAGAVAPDGQLHLAWEGQTIPRPGESEKYLGGDVDLYNSLQLPNVVLLARLDGRSLPTRPWTRAPLGAPPVERFDPSGQNEPPLPGPPPGGIPLSNGNRVFFGDLHTHSIFSDAKTGLPEQIFWLARDRMQLDFVALTDHAEMGRLQRHEYAENVFLARQFTNRRFLGIWGFEWTADPRFGHRIALMPRDSPYPLASGDSSGDDVDDLHRMLRAANGLGSPHHTGQAVWGRWNPLAVHDVEVEPTFEIASWHGRFEFYGNPREGRRQVPGHQFQDVLRAGRRMGVTASSDAHFMNVGEGGLTAVIARELTTGALFEALRNRHVYATTGAKIVVEFMADAFPMGSELETDDHVTLSLKVSGTAAIDRVDILEDARERWSIVRLTQRGDSGDVMRYDGRDPQKGRRFAVPDLRRIELRVDSIRPDRTRSYYARISQTDGHQAWTSPIWIIPLRH